MSVLFMATGWLVAGGAVCGASQVRVLGVLIPGWGYYLFVMIFDELFLVRVSTRTRPLLACCYCCCWLCFLLCTRCWLLCSVVASLTLMLTTCVHGGCLCFCSREGRLNNVKNKSGLLPEFRVARAFCTVGADELMWHNYSNLV